jgi:hypothetical protein
MQNCVYRPFYSRRWRCSAIWASCSFLLLHTSLVCNLTIVFIFFLFMELLLAFSAFHVHLSKVLKPFLSKHNLEWKEGHVYQGRQYITRHFENDNEFNIILQISFQNQLNHPCFKVWIWVTLNTKNGTKNPLELRVKESVLPWFFREQGRAYWIPTSSS